MKSTTIRGISCIVILLLAIFVSTTVMGDFYEGYINAAFGIQTGTTTGLDENAYRYLSDYTDNGIPSDEGMEKLLAAEDAFNETAEEESAVLVYNNGALPLSSDVQNVTLLGRAVVDPVYRCSAAGPTIDENRVISLTNAMETAGFNLNQTLLDAYEASPVVRQSGAVQDIGEVTIDFYTDSLCSSFANYGDAAIIMFSRVAGEGVDAAKVDNDGVNQLSLHKQESDLLELVKSYKDRGVFDEVIVLINSAYAMELDWIYDAQYGIDACLWIGNPGLTGFSGIPDLLTGEANPSGHFVDTYATDSLSAPATQNNGTNTFAGSTATYAVYAEGIYVGYKYYETRYEDLILDRYNAASSAGIFASSGSEWNYADEMLFPFGYGLSYTTFEQTLDSVTWNADNTITVQVTVTNTGDVAGKSVVQVYAQVPYTDYDIQHNVEKSAIQILDFAKTSLLEPGQSETVEITADKYLIASWDSTARGGVGGYILDDGDYYIAIGDNAHDALNNVLAAKGASGMYDQDGNPVEGKAGNAALYVLEEFDDQTYSTNPYSGLEVSNKFNEGIFATDYNYFFENAVTYLTRSDWNTFPQNIANLQLNDRMQQIHSGDFYDELTQSLETPKTYTLGEFKGIMFIDMLEVEWNDEESWTEFLSQLTIDELCVILEDSYGQKALSTINKPQNYQADGPDGGHTKYQYGAKGNNTTYVNEGTFACSWNKDLLRQRGEFMAEDALYSNVNCAMGPGVNIHRTPFSGRNFEYYSECGVLSYIMCSVQTQAMQEKGVVSMLKHMAANDQEANRKGVYEFMTEQTLRESSLKGFEGGLTVGGAMSVMASFNCLGCCNVARNYALLTDVVRNEWGFRGFTDTDANDVVDTPALAVITGIDEFCLTSSINRTVAAEAKAGDAYLLEALMKTNKRFYYTYLRSNLVNGLTADVAVSNSEPWWKIALWVCDGVLAAAAIAGIGAYLYLLCTKKDRLTAGGKR